MEISDELVELACATEQGRTGRHKWPEDWTPAIADEYRAGMRAFLAAIMPFIEADVLDAAFRTSHSDGIAFGSAGTIHKGTRTASNSSSD